MMPDGIVSWIENTDDATVCVCAEITRALRFDLNEISEFLHSASKLVDSPAFDASWVSIERNQGKNCLFRATKRIVLE